MKLLALSWRYPNGTRIPRPDRNKSSDYDVYRERFPDNGDAYTPTWWTVLHFRRVKHSYAGTYTCVANYKQMLINQSVKINVSSEQIAMKHGIHYSNSR